MKRGPVCLDQGIKDQGIRGVGEAWKGGQAKARSRGELGEEEQGVFESKKRDAR